MSTIFADNFKNTSGGDPVNINEVKTDKITGKTTAGSIPVQSEGTATTNLQQGLGKWWCAVIQATNTVKDSFNVSGTTDTGTGRTQYGYTNNMSNDGYCVVGTSRDGGGYNDMANCNCCTDSTYSSSQVELFCTHGSSSGAGTPNDSNGPLWAVAHGDLA